MDRPAVMPRRSRWLVATAAAAGVGLAATLAWPAVTRWSHADRAVDASAVRLATITRGDLSRDVSVQGRVVAALSPTLFSPGQGIVSLRAPQGAQVKSGDVLAVIDSKELQAALDQARAQLLAARAELDRERIAARQIDLRSLQQINVLSVRLEAAARQQQRAERTFQAGLSSRLDYDTAQDAVRVATMELEQAKSEQELSRETARFEVTTREQQVRRQESVVSELQKRVDGLTLRAPFDGMIATVSVQDRDAVAPNQAVLSVVNLSSLEVQIGLPEEYATETTIGTPAAISFNGHDYRGNVTRVSPEVVDNEVPVRVAFDGDAPAGLKQNQRLTTTLTFEAKRNVLKAPRGAFLDAEGGHAAYVVADGTATRRPIVIGATSVNEVEVVEGLRESETIVISDTSGFDHAPMVILR